MLAGSVSIGRIAGIDLRLRFTFLLFLGWIALRHWVEGRTWIAAATGLFVTLTVFAVIVLHEIGHAPVAHRFGVKTHDIALLPIGAVGRMERMPERPRDELAIALATSTLLGVPITRDMLTELGTLSADDTLRTAAERMLGGFQAHFPVVDGARPIGVLSGAQRA